MACYGYINRAHDVIIQCIAGLRYFQTNSYWAQSLEKIGFSFGAYLFTYQEPEMGLLHAIWMDIIGHGWLDQISMDRSMSEKRERFFYNCAY